MHVTQYRILKVLTSVPNLVLCALWIHHLVEIFIINHHYDIHEFSHPWFIFAATISSFLFLFHFIVFMILTFHMYRYFQKGRHLKCLSWFFSFFSDELCTYKEIELFMMVLDSFWNLLWILQLLIQFLLPDKNRLYPYEAIYIMFGLYLFQILFSVPLMVIVYKDWRKLKRTG